MSLPVCGLAQRLCASHTWDKGDCVLATELGGLEDVGVGGGVAWIASQLESSLVQAEGMGRAYSARRSKGLQRRSAEGPARGGVSSATARSGQHGGVIITEAAREEGLHSMVGYVREVRRLWI